MTGPKVAPAPVAPDWTLGACAGIGTDLFYPTHQTRDDWRTPKEMCAGCQIRDECLTWALATDEPEGIWGGLDPNERAALRRHRRTA